MKIAEAPHGWNVSPSRAIEIQKELAARLRLRPARGPLKRVAGIDAAFSRDGKQCIAGVVVWDRFSGRVIEQYVARRKLRFPYIPGLPTLGCAKSRLTGEHFDPGPARGARAPLFHRGEVVGAVLRTRAGVKPVYVSVGHDFDLATAIRLVLQCSAGYRLPEPVRLADQLVTRSRLPAP